MKKDYIRSVDLKLARALTQADYICEQIKIWTINNPVTIKAKFLEERLGYEIFIDNLEVSSKLDEWSILVGEFMHNLRSALDNLSFALARIQQDPPENPNQIYFPIFIEESEYNKKRSKIIVHFPAEIASLIERLQPFQRASSLENNPKTDALFALQWFNNIDKHRIPSVIIVEPTGKILNNITVEFYCSEDASLNVPPKVEYFGYALKKGGVLMRHITNKPINRLNGEFTFIAQAKIEGVNGIDSLEETLKWLYSYTSLIVGQFRQFFE